MASRLPSSARPASIRAASSISHRPGASTPKLSTFKVARSPALALCSSALVRSTPWSATQGVNGQFETLLLPTGFQWNVAYGATNVVLSVTGIGLDGDFNGDNKVDMADYVVWRKTNGTPQN